MDDGSDTHQDMDLDPDPYGDTGKTCLGGGTHCPSASSFKTCANVSWHDDGSKMYTVFQKSGPPNSWW